MPANTFGEHIKGRRDTDGESGSIPWQIRAVAYMGVPSAIACYLVWVLAQSIVPSIVNQQQTLNGIVLSLASTSAQISAMQGEHSQMKSVSESMLRVLQVSCTNAAPNNEARANCFR